MKYGTVDVLSSFVVDQGKPEEKRKNREGSWSEGSEKIEHMGTDE